MIYAMSYSWERSEYLVWLLNKSLHALSVPHLIFFPKDAPMHSMVYDGLTKNGATLHDKTYYEGGHGGWPDAMHKINSYKIAVQKFNIGPNDWLIDMDDDTYMCNDSILKLLNSDVDLVGLQHEQQSMSKIGMFGHMSGACVCMRGETLLNLLAQKEKFWEDTKKALLEFEFSHMWDVVVSYALISLGARLLAINHIVDCGLDPEMYFQGKGPGNFFHFNYACTTFLGEPTPNIKYDIPLVLLKKGLINE